MTTKLSSISPELAGLLADLARDPEATLLAVPSRTKAMSELLGGGSPRRLGQSALERHIESHHAAEVVHLLHDLCRHLLYAGDASGLELCRYESWTVRHGSVAIERVASRARELDLPQEADLTPGVGQEIEGFVDQVLRGRAVSVVQIASLADRFQPSAFSPIVSAIAHVRQGTPQIAVRLLRNVLEKVPHDRESSYYAWLNMGYALSELDEWQHARRAYRMAHRIAPEHPAALMSWFSLSLDTCCREDALAASSELSSRGPSQHPSISAFISRERTRFPRGRAAVSPDMSAFLAAIESHLGPAAMEIAHAEP